MELQTLLYDARRSIVLAERAMGPQRRIQARAAAFRALNAAIEEMLFLPPPPSTSYPPTPQRRVSGFLNPDITS